MWHTRKTEQIADEALLDGIYVLRTDQTAQRLSAPAVVRVYNQLKVAETAFNAMKSPEIEDPTDLPSGVVASVVLEQSDVVENLADNLGQAR